MPTGRCPACGESFDPTTAGEGLLFRATICPHCNEAFPVQPPEL
jgi:hypothetical protein